MFEPESVRISIGWIGSNGEFRSTDLRCQAGSRASRRKLDANADWHQARVADLPCRQKGLDEPMLENLAALAADPAAWVALLTLIAMEVVLGIDNLIFISILHLLL